MPRKRKKVVSLKPIEREILKARKALLKAKKRLPRKQRKAIGLKIRQLDGLRQRLEFVCCDPPYNIVFPLG